MSEWDGVPPNPEQSGWHWLQEGKRDPQPFEWCSGFKNWWLGDDEDHGGGWQATAKRYHYLGPAATPEETAAQAAHIAELEAVVKEIISQIDQGGSGGKVFARDYCIQRARKIVEER